MAEEEKVEVDQEVKLLILGDNSVGKSSLISQFVFKIFPEEYNPTVSTDNKSIIADIKDRKTKINLIDVCGDSKLLPATRTLMRDVQGCVCVFDVTRKETFEDLTVWFEEIISHENIFKKVLAGNKCDQADTRQVTEEEGKAVAEKYGMEYVETSASKALNVDTAFMDLVNQIADYVATKQHRPNFMTKEGKMSSFARAIGDSVVNKAARLNYLTVEAAESLIDNSEFNLPQLAHNVSYSDQVMLLQREINESHKESDIQEFDFQRMMVTTIDQDALSTGMMTEMQKVCCAIQECVEMRDRYIYYDDEIHKHPLAVAVDGETKCPEVHELSQFSNLESRMRGGIFRLSSGGEAIDMKVPDVVTYYDDLGILMNVSQHAPTKAFAYKRLNLLEKKYGIHQMYNKERELIEQKKNSFKDFYTVNKVDTHIHHSACMSQKLLLEFIREKLRTEPDEIVHQDKEGVQFTLRQVFDNAGIRYDHISSHSLDVQADHMTFQRFDIFNTKYNLMGQPLLREIFLKTENFLRGRYIAEITKRVFDQLKAAKFIRAEYRISIYGRNQSEWKGLSKWFTRWEIESSKIAWMIQVPRLYWLYKKQGTIENFQDMLTNIFEPVMQASLNPEAHPEISAFLSTIIGFDSVDDESLPDTVKSAYTLAHVSPDEWNYNDSPPYSYWMYYMYANITLINKVRAAKGMNTFTFRPHCGEAGSAEHLGAAYLTSHGINHGIELYPANVIQYLYYLKQLGIAMSPLSNNKLFLAFTKNPCPKYLARGLNISLSTDDPLIIHLTDEPLLEEYSVATQVWNFSVTDLSEIVRNSVIQSGFSLTKKKKWLGEKFLTGTAHSNDMTCTDFSNIRHQYRYEIFVKEREFIKSRAVAIN